ncbi:hypothetical protein [Streptomyces sp. NPDC057253]|uniref:hypothetical protein n=1 Tax=Streptomyces sp. NPDC057253 TaxID=3346069 RepID=UPI00362661EC
MAQTWLVSSEGRALALVSNAERAMVSLLDDEDTVPLADALRIVAGVVEAGTPPADVAWCVDR